MFQIVEELEFSNTSLNRKLLNYFRRQNEMKGSMERIRRDHAQAMEQLTNDIRRRESSQPGQEATILTAISTEL